MWWWILTVLAVASDEVGRRYSVLPLPTIDYTPETGLAGGVVVLATGHPFTDARQSVLELEGTLTTQRQRIFTTDLQLFLPSDRLLLSLSAAVMRFPEDFWGIGPDTAESDRERYTADRVELRLEPLWGLPRALFIGPSLQTQRVYNLSPSPGGLLDGGSIPGSDGGRSVGLGYAAVKEGRAHPVTPAAGEHYAAVRQQWYRPALGSDHRFSRLSMDGRAYLAAGPGVLALHGLALFHGGSPPFRMLALLGGDQITRGYYTGRYRDQHMLAAQVAYRQPLLWRLGVVAFLGAGAVTDQLSSLSLPAIKPTIGGGLRLRLDEEQGTNLRIDLAFGQDSSGMYFSFGEAF